MGNLVLQAQEIGPLFYHLNRAIRTGNPCLRAEAAEADEGHASVVQGIGVVSEPVPTVRADVQVAWPAL